MQMEVVKINNFRQITRCNSTRNCYCRGTARCACQYKSCNNKISHLKTSKFLYLLTPMNRCFT